MKIFMLAPKENWVVDRLVSEFNENNKDIIVSTPEEADLIWLLAGWCWNHISLDLLKKKKVIVTMWHAVPERFTNHSLNDFAKRDQYVDLYHAPSLKSKKQIEEIQNHLVANPKPIKLILPWVNQELWFPIDKSSARKSLGIKEDRFVIGSFQRDTMGRNLTQPKLEKGPDLFCNIVENIVEHTDRDVEVLLGAWRRQYVISRLESKGIKYTFNEMPREKTLNVMYNALDLYIVASRYEGGPQSVVECAASKTPIVSTDVGIASSILAPHSIFGDECIKDEFIYEHDILDTVRSDVEYAYDKVSKLFMPESFDSFRSIIETIGGVN